MNRIAFISTTFDRPPAQYQGSHEPEEPLDILYAINACADLGEVRLVNAYDEHDAAFLAAADVVVHSTTISYLQWNNHPLGLSLFSGVFDEARRHNPSAPRVVFGPHVPVHWAEIQAMGAAAVLLGEAELEMADVVADILAGRAVQAPSLMGNPGVRAAVVERLDNLPVPAYHESVRNRYAAHNAPDGRAAGHLYETSRGCPYFCSFCNTVTHRRAYRTKSPAKIEADLSYLAGLTDRDYIYFIDESFGFRQEWFDEAMPVLAEMPFAYGCQGNLRFITPQKLDAMAEAGFISMEFGFETANEEILRAVGKNNRLSDAAGVLNYAASSGVQPLLFVLVGLPGENEESLGRTIAFFRGLDPRVRISVGMPTPYIGTKLHSMGVASGVVDPQATGARLYDYTGRIGHGLDFDRDDAAVFLSTYGPNNTLTPELIDRLESDIRRLYGFTSRSDAVA